MKRALPPVTLIAMTAVFPELFSGNTPVGDFFRPPILLLFIVAYGLPILLIREIALRAGTGWFGIFVMGLGYGLINEGLYARTIFRAGDLPVPTFNGYGYAFYVNWPFAAFICTWHAVSSVLLPIALTARLFPGAPAMSSGWLRALGAAVFSTATAFFLIVGNSGGATEPVVTRIELVALAALWVVIVLIWSIGRRMAARPGPAGDRKGLAFLLGLSGVFAFILAVIPSDSDWPVAASFLVLAALVGAYASAFRRWRLGVPIPLGWFAFGWYLQVAAFSWTVIAASSPMTVAADIVLLALVFAIARHGIPDPAARNT